MHVNRTARTFHYALRFLIPNGTITHSWALTVTNNILKYTNSRIACKSKVVRNMLLLFVGELY